MTADCSGKLPYPSRRAAITALGFMRRRPAYRGNLHAYRCPECHVWHLGRPEIIKSRKPKEN